MSNTVSLKVGSSPLKMTAFHNAATDDDDDVDVGQCAQAPDNTPG